MESQPLPATAEEEPRRSIGALIALFGALLIIVGSTLPWRHVLGTEADFTTTGIEGGDGWISLALGVVIVALALRTWIRSEGSITPIVVVTAALGLLVALQVVDIRSRELPPGAAVDIGWGLWLVVVGVVLSIFGIIRIRAG